MIEPATTPEGIPVIAADPFSLENLAEPYGLHEQLREAGPLVHLDYYSIWGMARYKQVNAALKNWETFSAEIVLTTLARRVERIELTGQLQRKLNNTLRAWSSLPVTIHPASV